MEKRQVNLGVVVLLCALMAAAAGGIGYWLSQSKKNKSASVSDVAAVQTEPVAPAEQAEMTSDDWDDLIGDVDLEPPAPAFDPEDMEARRQRFENMTTEQRGMLRKAFGAAMLSVDGLEEVTDAIRQGKIDPRSFRIDLPAIADRMEIHAETMDQEAMNQEVTKTMQDFIDQARAKMK